MSVESKRRHGPRSEKIFVRSGRERQIVERLEEELEMFMMGEPTEAFYPLQEEVPDVSSHVLFDVSSVSFERQTGRKGDIAKRRAEIINAVLENPQSFPVTKTNLSFIERHFPRIIRFAQTLKHKGKLHPDMEKILEV